MFEIILRFLFRLLDLEHLRHFWDYWGLFFLGKTSPLALYLIGLLSVFFKRCCVWFLSPVGLLLYIGFQKLKFIVFHPAACNKSDHDIRPFVWFMCVCYYSKHVHTHTHPAGRSFCRFSLTLYLTCIIRLAAVAQLSTKMSFNTEDLWHSKAFMGGTVVVWITSTGTLMSHQYATIQTFMIGRIFVACSMF